MDQIFDQVGRAISAFFDNPVIQTGLRFIALYIIAVWLVVAYWAYRDLQTRTSNPVAPYLAAALIILFTPFLFPFGVLLYRIMRPPETVAEQSERALAEEAMMVEVESQPHCANCNRRVHVDWIICPTCRNRLRRVCPNCSRLVELDWSLCGWCGKDFERLETPREAGIPAAAYAPLGAGTPKPLPATANPSLAPGTTTAHASGGTRVTGDARPGSGMTRPLDLGERGTGPERG